ncbi:MAG: HAMP domain-containing protein, partial [Synergistaceae bacterium]|nr:HAMP domain-containing protein [Synergistaceae bacterium]
MKIKVRFSLFWKVYLTMLVVLFLPIMIFALLDLFHNEDNRRQPSGIMQNLEWNAGKIAEESESIDDEHMLSWVAVVNEKSDLEIYIHRDGTSFFSPGAEWLADYVQPVEPHRPGQPLLSSVVTQSGRTYATAAMYPFGHETNAFRTPRIPFHMLGAVVICLIISFMLVRNFITPLLELSMITGKMQNGDLSVHVGSKVTERGDEFADLGRSFNKMATRVESLLSSQKRLLSDISHEIRSPLQRIEVAVALLRKGRSTETKKYIDRIELEIGHIDDMVEELLTLTRLEEMPIMRRETVELGEIICPIVDDVSFAYSLKKDNIHLNLQKSSVSGDAVLLSRALGNVIFNAARYTTPDTGIEIDSRQEKDRAVVIIRDHGQGVPEDELDKIFLPYYRTDKARVRSQGGVGL